MDTKRILSLDISTKTGWSLVISSDSGIALEKYGKIEQIPEPAGKYPVNYVEWAHECFGHIDRLIADLKPDMLTIEETASGSKNAYSQKILEWIHYLLAFKIKSYNIEAKYLLTEEWRREVGAKMTDAEKKKNKAVRDYKKKVEKETGTKTTVAYDINGKRIGLVGRKHVNVRRANEVFGEFLEKPLQQKDEDTADSLLLGYACHLIRLKKENNAKDSLDEFLEKTGAK